MATGTLSGFTLDRAGASVILKELSGAAVSELAQAVASGAGPDATVTTKVTKTRFVASVQVPAEQQATDGVLSRAAGALGLVVHPYGKATTERAKVVGFVSKRQWRWAFWSKKPWALGKARETPGEKIIRYQQLPEATGRNTAGAKAAPRKRGRPPKTAK